MKGGKTASGYTIIEVMIFLAVSGMLFVLAMLTINGQQSRANFTQGTRDFQASVDDVANDIRNGNFPDPTTPYTCTVGASDAPTFGSAPAGSGLQGTHEACIFLGKVVQFDIGNNEVEVYTVVGRREGALSKGDPTDFSDARPKIPNGLGEPNFQEGFNIPGGLIITDMQARKISDRYPVRAVGFFSAFTNSSNPDVPINSILIQVVPIRGSDTDQVTNIINGSTGPSSWTTTSADNDNNPDAVVICLQQGEGGKRAALIIGADQGQFSTALYVDDADEAVKSAMDTGGVEYTCPV